MSYDLAVWEGERPSDDADATVQYEALMARMDQDESPPTPRIRAFVEALLERWPDIDDDEASPWADSPVMGNAVGPIVYFAMVFSRAEEASAYAAQLAHAHGLVCYDPQGDGLS